MNITYGPHVSHRTLLFSLLVVVLVSSLFVCVSVNGASGASLENAVHVKNEDELKNALNNESSKKVTIALDNDVTLTNDLVISAKKDIVLTSNKVNGFYKLIGSAETVCTIVVEGGGVLELDGVIVTNFAGSGVTVRENGLLILSGGEISGNSAFTRMVGAGWFCSYGGGVYNEGTFEMFGGKISDNQAYFFASMSIDCGGGVYNTGIFRMSGGEISNNYAANMGGGVYNRGTFTMSGGLISDNKATDDGGVANMGTFDRSGGTISDNTPSDVNDHDNGGDGSGGSSTVPPDASPPPTQSTPPATEPSNPPLQNPWTTTTTLITLAIVCIIVVPTSILAYQCGKRKTKLDTQTHQQTDTA